METHNTQPADMQDSAEGFETAVVSRITTTKRDATRVMIRVDGKVVATLQREVVDDLGVTVGSLWTESLQEAVEHAVQFDQGKRKARNILNRRMLSQGELVRRLVDRGITTEAANSAAAHFATLGVIDDKSYGQAVLRQLQASKPAGERLMRDTLRKKLIEPRLIDELTIDALQNFGNDDTDEGGQSRYDHAAIATMIERKLRSIKHLDRQTQVRRLRGLLARRGFDAETTHSLIQQYVPDEPNASNHFYEYD